MLKALKMHNLVARLIHVYAAVQMFEVYFGLDQCSRYKLVRTDLKRKLENTETNLDEKVHQL